MRKREEKEKEEEDVYMNEREGITIVTLLRERYSSDQYERRSTKAGASP